MKAVPSNVVQLLMEIGYLAGGHGLSKESEQIFNALQAVRPESELPAIGLAVTKLNTNQPGEAVRVLWNHALQVNPESDLAKSFLGLSLKLAGMQSECKAVLEEVLATDRDPYATEMARSILAEIG